MKTLLVIASLFSFVIIKAQSHQFKVLSTNNRPIQGCSVIIDTITVCFSNSDGIFTLESQKNNPLITLKHPKFKQKKIRFNQLIDSTIIYLNDSSIPLAPVFITPKKLTSYKTGNTKIKGYSHPYKLSAGDQISSIITSLPHKFYIEQIKFFISDIKLPDDKRKLKISIFNETFSSIDSPTFSSLILVDTLTINKADNWYNLSIDTPYSQTLISTSKILVTFELLTPPPTAKENVQLSKTHYITLGTHPCNCNVTSYSRGTHINFESNHLWPSHKIPFPQKLYVTILQVTEE